MRSWISVTQNVQVTNTQGNSCAPPHLLSIQEERKEWANTAHDPFVPLQFITAFLVWFLERLSQKCPSSIANCSVFLNNRWNEPYVTFYTISLQSLFTPHFSSMVSYSSLFSVRFYRLSKAALPRPEFLPRKALQTITWNKLWKELCSILPTSAVGVGGGFNTWNRNCSPLLCSLPSPSWTFLLALKGCRSNKEIPIFLLFLH